MQKDPATPGAAASPPARREFLKQGCAACLAVAAVGTPAAVGTRVFLDPLTRLKTVENFVKVTTLDTLPEDGTPVQFPVLADRRDAWTKFTQVPIGAVFLQRQAKDKLLALSVVCPHAGCFVDYVEEQQGFLCPCHNSLFLKDGGLKDEQSPSPRPLDTLEVQVRNRNEVWVRFQDFQLGVTEKKPVA
ncbi:MAG: menaquinol-cytochrome c reductase iron-sulfur subunit [Limisphaerales bacterium]|nr:MAG: menaquinol-cytochrome c reductase iron-sulfur subunit [Limisphaerales bacterium]KAG0509099.1 MAG: menaquinol-cytochrome c reductase iron-sulfur subunit [Limisphaerales bacterium]TXT50806.1 MAG: menaquinol-cytochrome c reductase iron-sulfur subunit [Limisphaerales bacterium]